MHVVIYLCILYTPTQSATLNPQLLLNPQTPTLNLQPQSTTLNPQPSTLRHTWAPKATKNEARRLGLSNVTDLANDQAAKRANPKLMIVPSWDMGHNMQEESSRVFLRVLSDPQSSTLNPPMDEMDGKGRPTT